MLHDICRVFGISVEQMMYGIVLQEHQYPTNFGNIKETLQAIEDEGYIKNLDKRGVYTFILDDIYEFFDIIKLDIEDIIVIGLALHKMGYIVTEIFDNGFSVVFLKDEEARRFHSDLYDIIDSFIHRDNGYVEEKRTHYSDIMNSVRHDGVMEAMCEILGKSPEEFNFFGLIWRKISGVTLIQRKNAGIRLEIRGAKNSKYYLRCKMQSVYLNIWEIIIRIEKGKLRKTFFLILFILR